MNYKLDTAILIAAAAIFLPFSVCNAVMSGSTQTIENEKRQLAEFPELSIEAIVEGSWFNDLNSYLSDRFILREKFIDTSKKIELLYGVASSSGAEQAFVYLGGTQDTASNEADSVRQSLELLDVLQTSSAPETEPLDEADEEEDSAIETEAVLKTDSETTAAETTAAKPEDEIPETVIVLNQKSAKLGVGSGITLYAEDEQGSPLDVSWTFTGGDVLSVVLNDHGGVNITAMKKGSAYVYASAPDGTRERCKVTVYEPEISKTQYDGEADFFPSGLFIYGDAVYVQGGYSSAASQNFANIAEYYGKLFPKTDINVLVAPCSSILVTDPAITPKIANQAKGITNLGFMLDPDINFVNICDLMVEHKDEYLYFRSDHHWTTLGAYYAYKAFAESKGFEPTDISDFEKVELNPSYRGTMYQYTMDERVKDFRDVLDIYMPTKEHTMTIYFSTGGSASYKTCILSHISQGYGALIGSDNPYTIINVPENPQDLSILVFKDSFGNAMIPYLCEHYGNIHVVDPRYAEFKITELLEGQKISDILFLNNIQSVNSSSWARLYLKLAGVEQEK